MASMAVPGGETALSSGAWESTADRVEAGQDDLSAQVRRGRKPVTGVGLRLTGSTIHGSARSRLRQ
jgi:hypothetical protein